MASFHLFFSFLFFLYQFYYSYEFYYSSSVFYIVAHFSILSLLLFGVNYRSGHAAKVFNFLRHLTMNLLKLETSSNYGIAVKRRRCALSLNYLQFVLGFS